MAERLRILLADFRGFAVQTVCGSPFQDAVESVVARGRAMVEQGMTQVRISTLQDLERGKPTEADQIIGYVVRLAADLGVALPKVELLYRVIQGIEAARQPLGQGMEAAGQPLGRGMEAAKQLSGPTA